MMMMKKKKKKVISFSGFQDLLLLDALLVRTMTLLIAETRKRIERDVRCSN